jgi:hypothetical protein
MFALLACSCRAYGVTTFAVGLAVGVVGTAWLLKRLFS